MSKMATPGQETSENDILWREKKLSSPVVGFQSVILGHFNTRTKGPSLDVVGKWCFSYSILAMKTYLR